MSKKGYTLIEMIVALSLFMIILLGGTTLFTQNLRSGGLTEVDLDLNGTLRSMLDEMERTMRFGRIIKVDDIDRDQCLVFGTDGYTGTNVEVEDLSGLTSIYSLSADRIASVSSETSTTTYLNGEGIKINSLSIKWFCQSGISDKINLEINASSTVLGSGVTISRTVSRDLVLLNSSIN